MGYNGRTDGADWADTNGFFGVRVLGIREQSKKSVSIRPIRSPVVSQNHFLLCISVEKTRMLKIRVVESKKSVSIRLIRPICSPIVSLFPKTKMAQLAMTSK
jgi:hypothetical protein